MGKGDNNDETNTQAILRSLVTGVHSRLDDIAGDISGVKESVAGIDTAVNRNTKDIEKLQDDQSGEQKTVAGVITVQKTCGARKAHDAGAMPGNKTARFANVVAVVAAICGICALIAAVAAYLK